ncbi:MAG: cell division protein ZapE [Aestuariivita sp.]|nr:cell division protein ZapE [Aestuariivita sp.]
MSSVSELYHKQIESGVLQRDPVQELILPEFTRIATELANPIKTGFFKRSKSTTTKGLYIWGGVGRGKSMLMDLFIESIDNLSHKRIHFHAFMQEVHNAIYIARQEGVDDAISPVAADIAKNTRLLALDEMQISDITDAMIVGRLFEALFSSGVTTITTSNRYPENLYLNGLNRQLFLPFINLIKERMVVWELPGKTDYRQNRLKNSRVYFTPIGSDARAEIASVWSDLSRGASEELILHVKGRQVVLPSFSNGVARATFYELCGSPLGAADYLAIAEVIRVLILEDIPQLSRSNFNEAKRFVILIDALYEAHVRLICSADAQPEMLYVEGEGTFEFERTSSRLREMQAVDWGQSVP